MLALLDNSRGGRSPLIIKDLNRYHVKTDKASGIGHRQRPERFPARAGPPRRGRGPDQAPGDSLYANPGASNLSLPKLEIPANA